MSHGPLVSIGLPVYNGGEYLEKALDSLLAQTFRDFEIVICDNSSTDETLEICRRYQARDSRIRYYENSMNLGAAKNFNRTFELSTGSYFKWFAHDDLLAPSYLEQCVRTLDSAPPTTVLCFPRARYIDEQDEPVALESSLRLHLPHPEESFDAISYSRLLQLAPACFPIFVFGLVRSDLLRKTGLIRPYIMSDLVVVAELRLLGDFVEVPEQLFFQRIYCAAPSRAARSSLQGEAAWFDPTDRKGVLLPNLKLLREFLRAASRLARGRNRWQAYQALPGFFYASQKRTLVHRFWVTWSSLSLALVNSSRFSTIPIRLWMLIASLRSRRLSRILQILSPRQTPKSQVFLFAAERLDRRDDLRARSQLLRWLVSSDPIQNFAAASVIARRREDYSADFRELSLAIGPLDDLDSYLTDLTLGAEDSPSPSPPASPGVLEEKYRDSARQIDSPGLPENSADDGPGGGPA